MINSISDLGKYNSVSTRKNDSSEDQIKVLRSQEASIQKQIDKEWEYGCQDKAAACRAASGTDPEYRGSDSADPDISGK